MQESATKGILTTSYDDDGQFGPVEDKARKQYAKEVETGYYLPTHVFYRDLGKHRVTKFNFPMIVGPERDQMVPMIDLPMLGLSRSDLESIAVVGDDVTEANVEAFKTYPHFDRAQREKVKYVFEGSPEEWCFSNTLERGAAAVEPEKGELVYVLMGDTAMKYYFDRILRDPDIGKADLISNFNSNSATNRHWPRRFHWSLLYKEIPFMVKESQDLLVDVGKMREVSERLGLDEHIFDLLYSGRKAYANKGKSRKKKVIDVLSNNSFRAFLGVLSARSYSLRLAKYLINERDRPIPLSSKGINRFLRTFADTEVLLKADNNDPATIEDVDGLADWANLSEMLVTAGDSIHPFASEMRRFGEDVMPGLRRDVDFYRYFEEYMNSVFRGYELPEPFVANGEFINPFTSDEMERINPVIANRAKKIIKKSNKRHGRYLRKVRRKGFRF